MECNMCVHNHALVHLFSFHDHLTFKVDFMGKTPKNMVYVTPAQVGIMKSGFLWSLLVRSLYFYFYQVPTRFNRKMDAVGGGLRKRHF